MIASVVVCLTELAWAQQARVLLIHPEGSSPLIDEAVIRTRAELRAVGFDVSVASARHVDLGFDASDYGSLELRLARPGVIKIHALSPDKAYEYAQTMDVAHGEVDAEVIAIRAVEALRATMAQYARQRRALDKPVPTTVEDFARLEPTPADPAPRAQPETEVADTEPSAPEAAPKDTDTQFAAVLLAGPVAVLPSPSLQAFYAGRLGVLARKDHFQAGIAVETSFTSSPVSSPSAGQAQVGRDMAVLHLAWHSVISQSLGWTLQAGGGVARYNIKGIPADGFTGSTKHHVTGVAQLSIGVESWLHENYGWYVDGQTNIAVDAPQPRIGGESVAIIGQPGFAVSVGLLIGERD